MVRFCEELLIVFVPQWYNIYGEVLLSKSVTYLQTANLAVQHVLLVGGSR